MKQFSYGDIVPGCDPRLVCAPEDNALVLVAHHAALLRETSSLAGPRTFVSPVRRLAG